ncbi:MAG: hypothetical protein KKB70_06280 [Proteobacteria bacterium]|nr:hypothetical protein [Pseudomonadota bacterium]
MVLQFENNTIRVLQEFLGGSCQFEELTERPEDVSTVVNLIKARQGNEDVFSVFLEHAENKLDQMGFKKVHRSVHFVTAMCVSFYADKKLGTETSGYCSTACVLNGHDDEDFGPTCSQICDFFEQQSLWMDWEMGKKTLDQFIPVVLSRFFLTFGVN